MQPKLKMTPEDEQDLRDLQSELGAAKSSPWQPRCVARAFGSGTTAGEFVLTMQAWIDLDAVESPFLLGVLPEDSERALEDFALALQAFGYGAATPENCDGEELVALGERMVRAIVEAMGMELQLAPPEGCTLDRTDNGMGKWLPIMACLVSQMGLSLTEARALAVGQAFALIAGHRVNEGWSVAGENYALQDVTKEGPQDAR